jgi:hypothetical protein
MLAVGQTDHGLCCEVQNVTFIESRPTRKLADCSANFTANLQQRILSSPPNVMATLVVSE